MKIRTASNEQATNGDVPVSATFTTGYKQDLEVARRVIRQRRDGAVSEPRPDRGPAPAPIGRVPAAAH
jgi:hypothetical protein